MYEPSSYSGSWKSILKFLNPRFVCLIFICFVVKDQHEDVNGACKILRPRDKLAQHNNIQKVSMGSLNNCVLYVRKMVLLLIFSIHFHWLEMLRNAVSSGGKLVCVPQYSMQTNPVMEKTITHASMNIVYYIQYRSCCTVLLFFPLTSVQYILAIKKKILKVLSS